MQIDEDSALDTERAEDNECPQATNGPPCFVPAQQMATSVESPGVGAVRRPRRHLGTEQMRRRPAFPRPSLADLAACSVR